MDLKKILLAAIVLAFFLQSVFAGDDPRPGSTFDEYNERLDHSEDMDKVNAYVYKISEFIKQKCPQEYCKHVLIVGDDFVIPMERKIIETENGPQLIYSDGIYAVKSTRNVGETRDVFENETQIVFVVPASMNTRFRQAIDNLKSSMATQYGLNPTDFEEYSDSQASCAVNSSSVFWNKSIVIIGENNAFLNCNTFWKNSVQVFEMYPSPWGYQTNPRKQALIIKTNIPEIVEDAATILDYDNTDNSFHGTVLDTDGDGWTDKEELLMHTELLNKNDNYCTRMPSLKPIMQAARDPQYWVNALAQLTGASTQKSLASGFQTQSLWSVPALVTGVVAGGVLGITGGIESDIDFLISGIPQILGGAATIILNPSEWQASADYTMDSFLDPLGTKCELVKKGIDTTDAASKNYFDVVLPSLYEKAATTRPAIQGDWDDEDKRAFDSGFVTAYHAGFILEQIVVLEKTATEAGKALKETKFFSKAVQAAKDMALTIRGRSEIQWTADAINGFDRIAIATADEKALLTFEGKLKSSYGNFAYQRLHNISDSVEQITKRNITGGETLKDDIGKAIRKYNDSPSADSWADLKGKFSNALAAGDEKYADDLVEIRTGPAGTIDKDLFLTNNRIVEVKNYDLEKLKNGPQSELDVVRDRFSNQIDSLKIQYPGNNIEFAFVESLPQNYGLAEELFGELLNAKDVTINIVKR